MSSPAIFVLIVVYELNVLFLFLCQFSNLTVCVNGGDKKHYYRVLQRLNKAKREYVLITSFAAPGLCEMSLGNLCPDFLTDVLLTMVF